MGHRWAWIDEHITHHQIVRAVTALHDRPSPQQAPLGLVLRYRVLATIEILASLILVLLAFSGPWAEGQFILVLVLGTVFFTLGCVLYAYARPLANKVAARNTPPHPYRSSIIYQPHTSTRPPISDPEEEPPPPPLPADLI